MNNKELGKKGEDLACEYLIKNGYKILERNYRFSRFCEIDIIAQFKQYVVFVEVKTRKTNNYGTPMEAITQDKYQHIKTGVLNYVKENNINKFRIDAIGITLYPSFALRHLKNI